MILPIMKKMKWFMLFFTVCSSLAFASPRDSVPVADSPLAPSEQSLAFLRQFLRTDDQGRGILLVKGEPLSSDRILLLSPWDLMDLAQTLSGKLLPLSRFGNGDGDPLTQAWRFKIAAFVASADAGRSVPQEDLFDPALVLWDPGYIQKKNSWGQWTIRIDHRDIVQADLPTLSPMEVQQAVEVLTGRTYPLDFVLDHLEAFRAQLSVVPRLSEALEVHH